MVLALMFLLAATSIRAEPPDVRIRKKLVATGWDHPDAEGLLKHLSAMEKQPFDGVVLEVTGRTAKGEPYPLRAAFHNEKWQRAWFQASVDQLRSCKFTRFTDNFVTLGANPGNIDWFGDERWRQIAEHWRIAAWLAKRSGLKGLLFDPEPYTPPHSQFSYASQPCARCMATEAHGSEYVGRRWRADGPPRARINYSIVSLRRISGRHCSAWWRCWRGRDGY